MVVHNYFDAGVLLKTLLCIDVSMHGPGYCITCDESESLPIW